MAVLENDLVVGPITPANGVSLISLDFFFEDEDDIEVYKTGSETPLILTADYTVAGEGTSTGSITLVVAADGIDSYSVYLRLPLARSTDLQLRGQFRSDPFNTEMDRLWQAMQGVRATLDRSLQITRTSETVAPVVVAPDSYLFFDSNGDLITKAGQVSEVPVSTFMATLLDDTTLAAAKVTLGDYKTVALLKADTVLSYTAGTGLTVVAAGDIVQAQGFDYEVLTSGSSGHISNSAETPVQLDVLVGGDGKFNALAFSMVGDDSTDNSVVMATAFAAVSAANGELVFNGGIFRARSIAKTTLTGSLKISGVGASSVLDFTGITTAIEIANYDLTLSNIKVLGGTSVVRSHSTSTAGGNRLLFDNVHTQDVKRLLFVMDETVADLAEVKVIGGHYEGSSYPFHYEFSAPSVDNTKVIGATFKDITAEILLFNNRTNSLGSYEIIGNKFENLINNDDGGSDPDVHHIRCAGKKAVISGNVFDGMTLNNPGTATLSDSEPIRPHCDQLIVTNNVFVDCFFDEGAVVLKSVEDAKVEGNIFEITPAFRALYSGHSHGGVVTQGNNTNILGNTFKGMNGTLCDITGGTSVATVTRFGSNTILDCDCARIVDFNSSFGSVDVFDNRVVGSVLPVDCFDAEFGGDANSVIDIRNNILSYTGDFWSGLVNRNGIGVRLSNNEVTGPGTDTHLFTINASTDLAFLKMSGNHWKNIKGSIGSATAFTWGSIVIEDDIFENLIDSADTTTYFLFYLDIPNLKYVQRDVELLAKSTAGVGFNHVLDVYSSDGATLTIAGAATISNSSALASVTLNAGTSANEINNSYRNESGVDVTMLHKISMVAM